MHGRIYVLTSEKAIEDGDYYSPFEECTMMDMIPGCDGVIKLDNPEIKESIEWINDVFNLSIRTDTIILEGNDALVGIVKPVDVEALIRGLKANKERRITEIRKEVQKTNPDMWKVSHTAYMDSVFYFVSVDDFSIHNEMDILRYGIEPKEVPLYITQIYDYHS